MSYAQFGEDNIDELVDEICSAGWPISLSFQKKENRDRVAKLATERGAKIKRGSIRNQLIDPRYTVEGRHLPDRGMGNDTILTNLYDLERVL